MEDIFYGFDDDFGKIRLWHCNFCPLTVTKPKEIRILIPCGHVLCVECSRKKPKCCTVVECMNDVHRILKPDVQEGESLDAESQAEKDHCEFLVLTKKIKEITPKIESLEFKIRNYDKEKQAKREMYKRKKEEVLAGIGKLQQKVDVEMQKYQLARFMQSIERPEENFVINPKFKDVEICYLDAAIAMEKHQKDANKQKNDQLKNKKLHLEKLSQKKGTLSKVFKEVVDNPKGHDKPALLSQFRELLSDKSFDELSIFRDKVARASFGSSGLSMSNSSSANSSINPRKRPAPTTLPKSEPPASNRKRCD